MKSLFRKLLILTLSLLCIFAFSVTAYADIGGGGNSSGTGSTGSLGNQDGFHYYGFKFSLQKRSDLLTDTYVSANSGSNLINSSKNAGIAILANGSKGHKGEEISSGVGEMYYNRALGSTAYTGTKTVSVSQAASVLGLNANDLRNQLSNAIDKSVVGGMSGGGSFGHASLKLTNIMNYFNSNFSNSSGNTMLYTASGREAFYNRFVAVVGASNTISKSDWLNGNGVLVIEPVVGGENAPYCTFNTLLSMCNSNGLYKFVLANKNNLIGSLNVQSEPDKSINSWYLTMNDPKNTSYGITKSGTETSQWIHLVGTLSDPNKQLSRNMISTTDVWNVKNNAMGIPPTRDAFSSSTLYEMGWNLYGMSYVADSKGAANLIVRATQNKDGSYKVDAKASLVSEANGSLQVDGDDYKNKPSSISYTITGGQGSHDWDGATQATNIFPSYDDGYETYAYGAFLLSGGGKVNSSRNLEAMRKHMEGTISAKETTVISGDFNAGKSYAPNWKYATPQDTANYFASSTYGGYVSKRLVQNMVTNGGEPKNLAYNLTALANNNSKTGATSLKYSTSKTVGTAGEGDVNFTGSSNTFGMAVEYIVKAEPINSYISYAKLTYDANLNSNLTVGENGKVSYNKATEGKFTVNKSRYLVAIVSNCKANGSYKLSDNNRTGQSFWNVVKGSLVSGDVFDEQQYKSVVNKYLTSTNIVSSGTKKNATVSLGSDNGCGYSVFVLEISVPSSITVETKLELQDYQLNFIHQDILAGKGVLTGSGESVLNQNVVTTSNCVLGSGKHNFYKTRSNLYTLRHSAYSGTTVNADNSAGSNKFILYNTALGSSYTFNQTKSGISDIASTATKRYTYAWDLSRGIYGDVRAISALSGNSIDSTTKNYLMTKHKLIYGIKPDDTNGDPKSSQIRNSYGTIYNQVGDSLTWQGSWKYGGTAPKDAVTNSHSGVVGSGNGQTTVSDTYMSLTESGARPLMFNGLSIYELKVNVRETIYKYSTASMGVGSNTKANTSLTTGAMMAKSQYGYGEESAVVTDAKGIIYKSAYVSSADFTLKYYPEVRMKAYVVPGDNINGKNSITPKTVITMAELVRETKPSSMYLMKLDTTDSNAKINGEIYSDTMGTGTNAEDIGSKNNLPVIYGGSDVTLTVKPKDMSLKMYGYALDLVNYDVDKNGLKYADDATQPYTNIVNDTSSANRDPYTTWGNDGTNSTEKLFNQFNNWVVDVVNALDVDVALKVSEADSNGNPKASHDGGAAKEYNNFSVTMQKMKAEDYKATGTDGVFNIVVKRGDIDRTATEYKALINQIASDYGCDSTTAENLFKESDIYQSIVRSIEDIKDAENKSQNVNTSENGSHAVRDDNTNENWYDEEVKTFVVRRYEAQPVKLTDIILTDKIDYDAAPSSTAGKGNNNENAQQTHYNQRVGQWYLSVYLKKVAGANLYTGSQFFDPTKGMVKDWTADANKILVNNLYVDGADFNIPSATTSENLW